ncbi:hypothetical protein [Pediococcus ethanolidurans]|uniref:hypothetical protein n=1 Tax=Pediococcus ethanolidurans TaxID=319653 RepID=UPI00345E483D
MAKVFLSSKMKIDRRKQRSQAKLFEALIQKYQDNVKFDQIEVKEFCEMANVSRATFYRHHQDLTDIIEVQFLIVIADFEQQMDALKQVNFTNTSSVIITEIYANLELFKLVKWSAIHEKVQALFSGVVRQILILRDYDKPRQQFISEFLGNAILNFAEQIASAPKLMPQTEALNLYRRLLPAQL